MDLILHDQYAEKGKGYEWTWDKENSSSSILLTNDNSNIMFHPIYSTGTAFTKGNKPLEKGRHHFWEMLIETRMYGTDVMVGVGTANAKLHSAAEIYCALLGQDQESWGFSYRRYIQHNDLKFNYGEAFNKGDLVGVHLDTWSGTLQFFLNRKPLGVAYKDTRLNNVVLYPLISCTMAQCEMKLTYSCSIPVSLQSACLASLSLEQKVYISKIYPGLRYLSESIFVDVLHKSIDYDNEEDLDSHAGYVILDDFDYALVTPLVKRRKCL